jgi:hypothetical protein
MKKRILIIAGVLIVGLALAAVYLMNRNRTLSPPGSLTHSNGNFTVQVDYSRPSVRERLVFGSEEEGALQPYGKYWRLGANESTEITINKDILFEGKELKAGQYKIYAVPGPQEFEIGVNTELGKWGYSEPDYSLDLFKVVVPVNRLSAIVEQHTIRSEDNGTGIDLIVEFSDYQLTIGLVPVN